MASWASEQPSFSAMGLRPSKISKIRSRSDIDLVSAYQRTTLRAVGQPVVSSPFMPLPESSCSLSHWVLPSRLPSERRDPSGKTSLEYLPVSYMSSYSFISSLI